MNFDNDTIDTILTLEDFAAKYAEEYKDGDRVLSVEVSCEVDIDITFADSNGDEYTRTVDRQDMASILETDVARVGTDEDGDYCVCGFNM